MWLSRRLGEEQFSEREQAERMREAISARIADGLERLGGWVQSGPSKAHAQHSRKGQPLHMLKLEGRMRQRARPLISDSGDEDPAHCKALLIH